MDMSKHHTVQWWIIFRNARNPSIWMRWLEPGFQHVYAMKKSPGGTYWLIVDPARTHTEVSMLLVEDYPHPRAWDKNAVMLPVTAKITPGKGTLWQLATCTGIVKRLLGIWSPFMFTPYQLYRSLTNGR